MPLDYLPMCLSVVDYLLCASMSAHPLTQFIYIAPGAAQPKVEKTIFQTFIIEGNAQRMNLSVLIKNNYRTSYIFCVDRSVFLHEHDVDNAVDISSNNRHQYTYPRRS